MSKKYDVVAANGEYTTPEGVTKTRWLNCGVIVQTKNGHALKLDCIPTRRNERGELWFNLFVPQQRQQTAQQAPAPASPAPQPQQPADDGFTDDDIPF